MNTSKDGQRIARLLARRKRLMTKLKLTVTLLKKINRSLAYYEKKGATK